MAHSLAYLERKLDITEKFVLALGELVAFHMPAIGPQLNCIHDAWDSAVAELDKEFPDEP